MAIEDISYADYSTLNDTQLLNDLEVEWHGRNVLDVRDEISLKVMGVYFKMYIQTALTNPKELPRLTAQMLEIFKDLYSEEDEEEESSFLYRFDPISGTYREIIGAEKSFFKKLGKGIKKAKKKVTKIVRETGRWIKEHPVETALIVTAVVVGGVAAGALAGAGSSALNSGDKKDEDKEQKPTTAAPPSPPPMKNPSPPVNDELKPRTQTINPVPTHPSSQALPSLDPVGIVLPNPFLPTLTPSLPPPRYDISKPPINYSTPTPLTQNISLNLYSQPNTPNWAALEEFQRIEAAYASIALTQNGPHRIPSGVVDPGKNTFPPSISIDPDAPVRVYGDKVSEPKTFEISGKRIARGRIGGINGIGNNFEAAKTNANYLSQLSQNHHLEWVHNRSHSLPVDVIETVVNYHGYSASAVDLQENWMKFHDEYKNDPKAKYLQFCHSQGAIHVRNALLKTPKEIRDRVIVIAIAPATVVPKNLCFDSFNYASKRDPIPYGEAGFRYDAEASYEEREAEPSRLALKELIILEPHPDAPWFDHSFDSPTFEPIISRHTKLYIDEYGEFE